MLSIKPRLLHQNIEKIIKNNLQNIICFVLKANAYGFGIKKLYGILKLYNPTYIAIVSNSEAEILRNLGYKQHLIRLTPFTPNELEQALQKKLNIEEMVSTIFAATILNNKSKKHSNLTKFHLNLNTGGMCRFSNLTNIDSKFYKFDYLKFVGVMTHFPNSEINFKIFNCSDNLLIHQLSSKNLEHVNSKMDNTMIRIGGALYGFSSFTDEIITLTAEVIWSGFVVKGNTVGYNKQFVVTEDTYVTTLGIGYANGYFWNSGNTIIDNEYCPIIGKISMNAISVKTKNVIPIGSQAILIGKQGNKQISIFDLSKLNNVSTHQIFLSLMTANQKSE